MPNLETLYKGEDDEAISLVNAYSNLFATNQGIRVLGHMLYELRFFYSDLQTPEDVALHNYAMRLIKTVTKFDDNVFTDAFLSAMQSILKK